MKQYTKEMLFFKEIFSKKVEVDFTDSKLIPKT